MNMVLGTQARPASGERAGSARALDFRSDTVTLPTPAMRRAMAEAEVGDDCYGEDPSVNRLEQRAAEILKFEAALFVPTGTMGNEIAIKCHTRPGQEIICEERAHILNHELAMMAHFSGCVARPLWAEAGILTWKEISRRIAPPIYYRAQTGLIELENTHNYAGGTVYPQEIAEEICERAHQRGIPVHLDGARIFNAATALGRPASELARGFDSVMFCLSKGLGAPVGSMLVGSPKFIEQARMYRRALGGGMRQAGVLAAAGLIALEEGPGRLHQDHANARWLAQGLSGLRGIQLDPAQVRTNILVFDVTGAGMDTGEFMRRLAGRGLLASAVDDRLLRMVTHRDVDRGACEQALEILQHACAA